MDNEMVERVARAIFDKGEKWASLTGQNWETAPALQKRIIMGQARAAIEAMREPTEEMVEAGWKSKSDNIDGRPAWKVSVDVQARHQFVAMIDAALSPTSNDLPHAG